MQTLNCKRVHIFGFIPLATIEDSPKPEQLGRWLLDLSCRKHEFFDLLNLEFEDQCLMPKSSLPLLLSLFASVFPVGPVWNLDLIGYWESQ